jgi:transcriptional regulator with XRE-family HTH domain
MRRARSMRAVWQSFQAAHSLYTAVSAYERGAREPDLLVLLRYAKLAHASIDVLVDDMKDLPRK